MNFVLLELGNKKTKERPYVRLFTKDKIRYFQEIAPNDPPLLPMEGDDNSEHTNIQLAFSTFIKNYKNMLDKYFPLVRLSRKKAKNKPWITTGIKTSMKHCSMLHKKHLRKPNDETKELTWKNYKHELTNCIRVAETQHYRKLLADHNNSSQNLWKIFRKY